MLSSVTREQAVSEKDQGEECVREIREAREKDCSLIIPEVFVILPRMLWKSVHDQWRPNKTIAVPTSLQATSHLLE
jgi:hypothetical protein